MKKCRRLLMAVSATALISVLLAGTAMADPDDNDIYELDDVEWRDDSSAVATWDDDEDYGHYQVKLVRNGDDYGNDHTTNSQHYNFEDEINHTGSYTFRVRVRFGDYDEGEWYESDELDVDEHMLHRWHGDDDDVNEMPGSVSPGPSGSTVGTASGPAAAGVAPGWHQNGYGQWFYLNTDGTYPKNGWDNINGKWYYFNTSGIMQTGWIHSNDGNWYYCGSDGAMLTNTWTPDGYYVNASGIWQQNLTP